MSVDTWHDHVDATWNLRGVTHDMFHVVYLCEWITLSQVSKEGNKWKRKKSRKFVKKTCGMEKSGGSFLHFLNNSVDEDQIERREKRK